VAGAVAVSGLSSGEDIELATLAVELIGAQKLPEDATEDGQLSYDHS